MFCVYAAKEENNTIVSTGTDNNYTGIIAAVVTTLVVVGLFWGARKALVCLVSWQCRKKQLKNCEVSLYIHAC